MARSAAAVASTGVVFGHCGSARLVEAGVLAAKVDFHERCPGVVVNGNGSSVRCACDCHEGQTRCGACGEDGIEIDEGLRCVDVTGCAERIWSRTQANPLHQQLQECIAAGVAKRAEVRESRPPVERVVESKLCGCGCGEMTLGGNWKMGHDARVRGRLIRAAKDGDAEAALELRLIGWLRPAHATEATLARAREIEQGIKKGSDWLAARNAARIEGSG